MPPTAYTFDAADADTVLVSFNKEKRFRVHKTILSVASPFFRDMFSLPQSPPGPASASGDYAPDCLPEVDLVEAASVIDSILRYIYPVSKPTITTLPELDDLFKAAVKFQMDGVVSSLREVLVRPDLMKKDPIQAFVIAARYDLHPEIDMTAKATLVRRIIGQPFLEAFKEIPAYPYHILIEKHTKYENIVKPLTLKIKAAGDAACRACKAEPLTDIFGMPRINNNNRRHGAFGQGGGAFGGGGGAIGPTGFGTIPTQHPPIAPPPAPVRMSDLSNWAHLQAKVKSKLDKGETLYDIFDMGFLSGINWTNGCQDCDATHSYGLLKEIMTARAAIDRL
jgi:hypothetical protein